MALMAGIVCLIGLLMPTEGDKSYRVPEYLHLPVNFKLICSFVLGNCQVLMTIDYQLINNYFRAFRNGHNNCFKAITFQTTDIGK